MVGLAGPWVCPKHLVGGIPRVAVKPGLGIESMACHYQEMAGDVHVIRHPLIFRNIP